MNSIRLLATAAIMICISMPAIAQDHTYIEDYLRETLKGTWQGNTYTLGNWDTIPELNKSDKFESKNYGIFCSMPGVVPPAGCVGYCTINGVRKDCTALHVAEKWWADHPFPTYQPK